MQNSDAASVLLLTYGISFIVGNIYSFIEETRRLGEYVKMGLAPTEALQQSPDRYQFLLPQLVLPVITDSLSIPGRRAALACYRMKYGFDTIPI